MKLLPLITLAVVLAFQGWHAAAAPPVKLAETETLSNFTRLETPKPMPEVGFADAAGNPRTLAEFQGKVVLLNLWATWCIPCRREMPDLDRLQAEFGGPDFMVLALAVDRGGIEKVKAFLEEVGVEHLDAFVDKRAKALRALGAIGLPTTLLIDRQGREIGRLIGPAEWASPAAFDLVRDAIAVDNARR